MRGALRPLLLALLFAVSVVSSHAAEARAWSTSEASGGEHPSLELHLAAVDAAVPTSRLELPSGTTALQLPSWDQHCEPGSSEDSQRHALETERRARPRRVFTRLRIPRMHAGDDRPPRDPLNA